jgi:hypothetical protein
VAERTCFVWFFVYNSFALAFIGLGLAFWGLFSPASSWKSVKKVRSFCVAAEGRSIDLWGGAVKWSDSRLGASGQREMKDLVIMWLYR